jgi:hypothetical protein
MKTDEIKALDIKTLLSNGDRYVIPIYQRNYAWESKEIEQLIQDIIDYSKHHKDKNYYIGTLVVANNESGTALEYNTIDGQQRLTTLTILSAVIKNNFKDKVDMDWFNGLKLSFASRQKSTLSLNAVFSGKFENEQYETNIRNAYNICLKELDKKLKDNSVTLEEFTDYLYRYVKILRVPLPEGIDLNHYFEIMNSRGEQLEKHEILKAKLMGCFNDLPDREREKHNTAFDLIWEACANMEKYVQYGFSVEQRHLIFGKNDWNSLTVYDFDDFINKLEATFSNNIDVESDIDDILSNQNPIDKKEESEDSPDRFNSVVNFQNFLLHVLRVQLKKDSVALDDKRLIELFEQEMKTLTDRERADFSKAFIYNLLKSKFLFDKYVIKREFTANTDRWSLKSLKWYSSGKTKNGVKYGNTFGEESSESYDNDNRRILMLLSMFHVSIPSMSYKYWLNATLNYLMEQIDIDSKDYISYLEHTAKSFVYDRFLAENPMGYYEMIYSNKETISRDSKHLNLEKLKYGQIENNLIFNFVDYLLWSKMKDTEKDTRVKSFEYTFRSSVEHYYPQNPINDIVDKIKDEHLHLFGNLCLISHEKNSKLNNYSPKAKSDHYRKDQKLDSIKQFIMMREDTWGIKEIEAHNDEMIKLLVDNINSDYTPKTDVSKAVKWINEYRLKNPGLLIRALFCFDDFPKFVSGDKYNFLDFDYIRQHEVFSKFEAYVSKNDPANLNEIIKTKLQEDELKYSYTYLFIKYPELIEYCKNGNFSWEQDGAFIYLLEDFVKSKNKSAELYTFLLSSLLSKELNFKPYIDRDALYLHIIFNEDHYEIVNDYGATEIRIEIWHGSENKLKYQLVPIVNGNAKAVKNLANFNWRKTGDGVYLMSETNALYELSENYDDNVSGMYASVLDLLKNGLGIKFE